MFVDIHLRDFKGFPATSVRGLGGLNLLIGRSGVGKTSLLQALWILGFLGRPNPGDSGYTTMRLAHLVGVDPESSGAMNPWIYRRIGALGFSIGASLLTPRGSKDLELSAKPREAEAGEYPQFNLKYGDESVTLPDHENRERARQLFLQIEAEGVGSTALLQMDSRQLARPSYVESEAPTLARDGYGLPSSLAYLAGWAGTERIDALAASLRQITGNSRRIRMSRGQVRLSELQRIRINEQDIAHAIDRKVWGDRFEVEFDGLGFVPAESLSEGTLLSLGLLTLLHGAGRPRVVLLDDLDRALHPQAQGELISQLRQLQTPDVQIVATTHSPYLLDHVAGEEVQVLARADDGAVRCRRLDAHPAWSEWKSSMRTGEFWGSVFEDWVLEQA